MRLRGALPVAAIAALFTTGIERPHDGSDCALSESRLIIPHEKGYARVDLGDPDNLMVENLGEAIRSHFLRHLGKCRFQPTPHAITNIMAAIRALNDQVGSGSGALGFTRPNTEEKSPKGIPEV